MPRVSRLRALLIPFLNRSDRACAAAALRIGAITAFLLVNTAPLHAALTRHDLSDVGITPPPNAALPLNMMLEGEDGAKKPVRFWLGNRPSIWVLADYTCETLCGPVISIVSAALAHSGLHPGADFRLVVVGLDPKDTAVSAANMKQAQDGLRDNSSASTFLRGDAGTIRALTTALGFRSIYEREHDQFAHPAAAFVIAPDGRLSQVLSGLGVDPTILRLAIVSASNGIVGTWTDHIRLLCYGYDPASGTYSVAVGRVLAASAGATIAVLTLVIGFLLSRDLGLRRDGTGARRFARQGQTPATE
jgi:protein SCO1